MTDSAIAMGPTARTVGNVRMFAPAYGAPEQFDETVGAIGPWTDVYALALVALEAFTDRTVILGEHLGEFALKALDADNRPTPRALGLAVGDEVEAVFTRAVALSPSRRPQDAGELWGILGQPTAAVKQAFDDALPNFVNIVEEKPDEGAGGSSPPPAPSEPPPPATLRMDTPVPGDTSPVVELVRPPSNAPPAMTRPHAGTLRMAQAPPRSAAEALAAMASASPTAPTATVRLGTPPPPTSLAPPADPVIPRAPLPYVPSVPVPSAAPPLTTPPPILYPSSQRGAEPSRWGAWVWVLVVLVVGAVSAGAWLVLRGRSVDSPTTSPSRP